MSDLKNRASPHRHALALPLFILVLSSARGHADVNIIDNENHKLAFSARVALQYQSFEDTENGSREDTDELLVRRFRPSIKYSTDNWRTKLSWEGGKGRVNSIKDAYIQYRGFNNLDLKFGNETVGFSRAKMTSSAKQFFPERSLIGENNWGTPGRLLGIHAEASLNSSWSLFTSLVKADLYSDNYSEIRFVSPIRNTNINPEELNEGSMATVRVDYHIGDGAAYNYNAIGKRRGSTLSIAGFYWGADDDTPTNFDHYADASGIELSAAYRMPRLSINAQWQTINATINASRLDQSIKDLLGSDTPDITINLLNSNEATLYHSDISAGFMISPQQWEVAASYQKITSDSEDQSPTFSGAQTWSETWSAVELGVNYFLDKQRNKIQISYRDEDGIEGEQNSRKSLVLQWQYIF